MEENKSSKKIRKYNSNYRKKVLDKIKKLKDKNSQIAIFKVVNRDIGNNFSENKSGIYFNLNLISDDGIEEIVSIIKSYTDNETITETTEDKLTYKSYSENEIDLYNTIGPRLSNQERSILKKCKNINE
tara:strand:+ start:104 stop:490 length:387 start_codon:yes stop_codon:yes gene_type:complete